MQQGNPTTVFAMPWYERRDFEKMRLMSRAKRLPHSYEAWLDHAFCGMRQLLAKGCAVKIVTIHLDDYFAWLASEAVMDSAETRTHYVQELARAGSQLSGSAVHTDEAWSDFLTPH